ncbi:MAG: fucose isomerase [Atribacteria sp.]|nr:fucose isomerase [Candidatus Atribacteria bacterium]
MKDFSIRLGFVPTRRLVFDKEEAQKHKNLIKDKLLSWKVDLVDIDWLNQEGMLSDIKDTEKVYKYFLEKNVDALFLPHCNFGTESAVAKLGKLMNKPLLLWGPRDDAPLKSGVRTRDTQCGLFATSKVLRRFGVPFTYITNSWIEDKVFEKGFDNFLRVGYVVKAFRNLRIGMISTRPGEFWSVMANEGELLEKFGIEVIPVALTEVISLARDYKDKNSEKLRAVVEDIKGKNIDYSAIGEENLKKIVALKLAIKEWVKKEKLSAVAIQCWMALPDEYGVAPCFANAMLTDEKIPVVCETDIHGAITSVILQAANRYKEPIFFADLTIRHPKRDNSELLWHCGNFPYSLKAKDSPASVEWQGELFPGIVHWRLKGGEITVARFDGDNGKYSLLMGHAHSVEGPQTSGTYLWVEVNDWPLWEEKFIRGPYIHHVTGIYGKFAPVLYEACRYIPELIPDAIEPTEEELKRWLRE